MGTKRAPARNRAIKLRLSGKSYNEIRKILNVSSKGTISYWLHGLHLSAAAKKKLAKNIQIAHDHGLFKFNTQRTERIKSENEVALRQGRDLVKKISVRELMLIGAALYWGEGTKSISRNNPSLSFANSDPKIIATFMRFIREIIQPREIKIRAGIHIYEGMHDTHARRYWSRITQLPSDRFYIVRQVSRASKGRRVWNRLPYGTAVIRLNDRRIFYRVLGMIEGLAEVDSR